MSNLNKKKLIEVCKSLGLEIEFNSENPGMTFISEDGSKNTVTWDKIKKDIEKEWREKNGRDC